MQHSGQKRIILWANPGKPQASKVSRELLDWLAPRAQVVGDNLSGPLDPEELLTADFIITLGGDGTLLSTVRKLGDRKIPLIGVNMGKLGFLAEFSIVQLKEQFEALISDSSLISERMMMEGTITGPDREPFRTIVANELAVIAGPPFRLIEVSISIGPEHLAVCWGDGLIVSTPTGSTAYNLSAGGPILDPRLRAAVITPLAAHSLSFRPIVVNMEMPIVLRCPNSQKLPDRASADPAAPNPSAVVVVDGQDHIPVGCDDRVELVRSEKVFQLVRNPQQGPWRLLNTKLHWGALPQYQNHIKDDDDEK